MANELDFFYFIGSTYTYLSVMRIDQLATEAGVKVHWRPFNVRDIMIEMDNIPFRTKPIKLRYMWRDIERRAKRYGLPFVEPPVYPIDPANLAGRVGAVAAEEGWCPAYTKASYEAWFLRNQPLGEPDVLAAILSDLGKEPEPVLAQADAERTRQLYATATDRAHSLGIFGSPTFVVGSEIFWGDDRLEDAIDWSRQAAV